ncbi:MED22-like protein [Mya arenaria]|uniref:Mediator of RNA polymerase II transcription subunit 22 n=2 Tax=Mya arenaria TaxID=6604 RepID=A0ABY7GBY7_MYAAR|nr:MED22-like protein [Mya arenaria]
MKLVSDLKIYLILNDFPSVNESISNNTQMYKTLQNENDAKLLTVRDDLATDLYELEDEYYSSMYK